MNVSIRNILLKIEGTFTEKDIIETEGFFNYKCPYISVDLKDAILNKIGKTVIDHIILQNKEYCGFNIKGNLVFILKAANSKKI